MLTKASIFYIVGFKLVIAVMLFLFSDLTVDLVFFGYNYLILILSFIVFFNLLKRQKDINEISYKKFIFRWALILRFIAFIVYSFVFYIITDGSDFDVEAIDALYYHQKASYLANDYNLNSILNLLVDFDDSGYIFILSLKYYLFGDSVYLARFLQIVISSISVVLVYQISLKIFNTRAARYSSILLTCFQPVILYSSIHMKETYMIFFMLAFINTSLDLLKGGNITLKSLIIWVSSLVLMFSFRTVLALILFSSFFFTLILIKRDSLLKKIIVTSVIIIVSVFSLKQIKVYDQIERKLIGYTGLSKNQEVKLGGRSASQYENYGQSFAKYASVLVLAPQAFITPYPSFVKTNIVYFNQTLQWYFSGGLVFWLFFSFFIFLGLYHLFKHGFNSLTIFLSLVTFLYALSLVISFYITAVRHNLIKTTLLMFFIGYGLTFIKKKHKPYLYLYSIAMLGMILVWNYVKLKGRGEI